VPAVVAAVLLVAKPARATSFYPYPEQRIVDSNGHYYVVVKRKDDNKPYGAVSLIIAEATPGLCAGTKCHDGRRVG
jgi:hypothetical protein